MSQVIEFQSKQGSVFVEVERLQLRTGENLVAASQPGVAAKVSRSFEDALAAAKPGIEAALDLLTSLVQKPNEAEIEFGLKIDAAAGAIFAKAGAEATFKIKLTWKK
jgi:hypothetical protein